MQPGQAGGGAKNSSALKRFGPIIGLVAAVGIGIGALVISGGDDDKAASPTTPITSPPSTPETTPGGTSPVSTPAEITYPLSFTNAKDAGIDLDWGDRCDTNTGRVAVPDFFAAECFAPFNGDNGGATAQGVTADEITIVFYQGQTGDPIIAYITDAIQVKDTNAQQAETMQNMVAYFESHYETYGRKVKLVPFEGTGNALDEVQARADALKIAEEIKPFMVWGGPALTSAFADELAAHQIGCISCTPGQPADFYTKNDPYVFGIVSSAAQSQVHILEVISKQLVGKNATHAGDEFVNTPRKFGLLYIESSKAAKDLADNFEKGMADAGAPLAERVAYQLDPGSLQTQASQAIAKFKAAGVTTVVFSGDPVAPREFTKEATAQGYSPEWYIGNSALVDLNAFARTYDQDQWKHAFGYTYLAGRVSPEISGYYALYKWYTGTEPPAKDTIGIFAPYPAVFYAVLQGVGPNLTSQSWRDALFSNPPTTSAISQPSLSWGDSHKIWPDTDYQGIDDATLIWWDPTASGPDEIRKQGQGMYQFVDGGKRYLPGEYPTEDKFFNPDGAITIYTVPPPGEAPPTYPSPAG